MIALGVIAAATLASTAPDDPWALELSPGLDLGPLGVPLPTLQLELAYAVTPQINARLRYETIALLEHRLGPELRVQFPVSHALYLGAQVWPSIGGYGVPHELSNWLTRRPDISNIGGIDVSLAAGLIATWWGRPGAYAELTMVTNYVSIDWYSRSESFVDKGWYWQGTRLTMGVDGRRRGIRFDLELSHRKDETLLVGGTSATVSIHWHWGL